MTADAGRSSGVVEPGDRSTVLADRGMDEDEDEDEGRWACPGSGGARRGKTCGGGAEKDGSAGSEPDVVARSYSA